MPAYTYTSLPLMARHVLDDTVPAVDEHGRPQRSRAGFLEIGTEIDGVFVKLANLKAGGILTDIRRLKEKNASNTPNGG